MTNSVRDRVQRHFRQQASTFDSLYQGVEQGEGLLQRVLRPTLFYRREFAADVVRSFHDPSVLDIGCGSGRVAQTLMEAGTARYTGVDFSEPMLDLARAHLAAFGDRITLIAGDFMTAPLSGPFDVVVALGFFDYIQDPVPFVQRAFELCSGAFVASFPRWSWLRGPVRKIRYEVINSCPIFDYTDRELHFLFKGAGFSSVETTPCDGGYMLKATK